MICNLCPRKCNTDRSERQGFCASGDQVRVAKVMLHRWEEPCISGDRGSGAVFFSGCSLKCCFCQNYQISHENYGRDISCERLAEIFIELQDKGAHNINLVNPTHFVYLIMKAVDLVRGKISIPIVYNCGGYERAETIRALSGYVDIYLPDFKYADNALAKKYSGADDYFENASEAIKEMYRQTGKPQFGENGIMKKGMLVRHLVLPGHTDNSLRVLDWIAENLPPEDVSVSVMSQYTPFYKSCDYAELNRRVSEEEYEEVLDHVCTLKLEGFMQELSSAEEEYVPDFNLDGVDKK